MNCDCTAKRNDIEENKRMKTNSNAGFTLVEVMLAMAILAIVTISLLNYFGTSLTYNTKMAASQKATLFAQEVAEELKGQDTLIQSRQELQPDGTTKKIYTIPYLLDSKNKSGENKYEVMQNNLDSKGIGNISFKGAADKIDKNYDVMIDVKSGEDAWDKTKKVYGFDSTDSILAVDENQDDEALLQLKSLYSSQGLTDDEIKAKIKRTIDIEISRNVPETQYTVNVKYIYAASGIDSANSSSSEEKSYNILSGVKLSKLNKIFLIYHTFNQNDYININNTTTDINIPGTLYLVAQKKTDYDSLPANYNMNITGTDIKQIYSNVGTADNGLDNSHILKNGVVASNVKKLSKDDFASVNTINFKVSVYEKERQGQQGQSHI